MNEELNIVNQLRSKHKLEEGKGFVQVSPEEFVECRNQLSEKKRKYLTMYSPEEIRDSNIQVFLSVDRKTGFGLKFRDIVNVFSLEEGNGKHSVIEAINNGGKRLICFDKSSNEKYGLPDYYGKFSFVETERVPNWDEGEPDLVYMSLDGFEDTDDNEETREVVEKHAKEASELLDVDDYRKYTKETIESLGEPTEEDLEKIKK